MARRRPTPAKSSKKNNPSQARIRKFALPCRVGSNRAGCSSNLHGGDVFRSSGPKTPILRALSSPATPRLSCSAPIPRSPTACFPVRRPLLDTMQGEITQGPDAGIVGAGFPPEALPEGGGSSGSGGASTAHSANIWAIYVTQSDSNSAIAIAATNPLDAPTRPMLPYTGSETLLVRPTSGGTPISVSSANTGDVYIGFRAAPAAGHGNERRQLPNQ